MDAVCKPGKRAASVRNVAGDTLVGLPPLLSGSLGGVDPPETSTSFP